MEENLLYEKRLHPFDVLHQGTPFIQDLPHRRIQNKKKKYSSNPVEWQMLPPIIRPDSTSCDHDTTTLLLSYPRTIQYIAHKK